LDMLDAALAIREFTSEMSYGQYIPDMKTRMAVELRCGDNRRSCQKYHRRF
jgi:uncharacterized protein with HEPN domain